MGKLGQLEKVNAIIGRIRIPEMALVEIVPGPDGRRVFPEFKRVDSLIIDYIGEASPEGLPPSERRTIEEFCRDNGFVPQKTAVLDLAEEADGNGTGMGWAEYVTYRFYEKWIPEKTYPDAIETGKFDLVRLPMIVDNQMRAFQAAIMTSFGVDEDDPSVIRIKSMTESGRIWISSALYREVKDDPRIRVIEEPKELVFNAQGDLF